MSKINSNPIFTLLRTSNVAMIRTTDAQDVAIKPSTGIKAGKLTIICLVILAFGGGLFSLLQHWGEAIPSTKRDQLRTDFVVRGNLTRDISAMGTIVAANAPTLYSPVKGNIDFLFPPGSQVEEGQVIAKVISPELLNLKAQESSLFDSQRNELEREKLKARRTVLQLRQELDLAKVSLDAAEREKNRAEQSHNLQLISEIDYQEALDDLSKANVLYQHALEEHKLNSDELAFDIKTRESNLLRQSLVVEDLKRKVQQLNIRAPVAGVVGNWLVEQKSHVDINQGLLVIVDLSAYEAELKVPESYADELAIGQQVNLNINGIERDGTLISISPEVKDQQVNTRVKFNDANSISLRQNQRVSARIFLEHKDNVLMVKRGAFMDAGGRYGYRVEEDYAFKSKIRLGGSSISHVEILSGAEAGDEIIISSIDTFNQADKVALR